MIDTLWIYGKRHVSANWRRIVQTFHPYLSAFFALLVAFDRYNFGKNFDLDQSFSLFLNYDTVIFGFTATAMAITLTISSNRFLDFISSKVIDGRTAFRSATFILSWNSLIHSLAFASIFIVKNSVIPNTKLPIQDMDKATQTWLFFALWIQFYAFFQFVVTNLTLFEVSDLFGIFLQKEAAKKKRDEAPDCGGASDG